MNFILHVKTLGFGALVVLCAAGLHAETAGPLIVLGGPPLSGKTTQISVLEKDYGIQTISPEDLIQANADELRKSLRPGQTMNDLRFDPAMTRFLRNRLQSMNLASGVALDGYPATRYQAEAFNKLYTDFAFSRLVLLHLKMSDDVVRKRAAKAGRAIDSKEQIEQRLKDYHREFDAMKALFPNAKVIEIDATQPEAAVSAQVRAALKAAGIEPKPK